jgi:ribosomal protein S18 acetylase RimI-like enzyme
MKNRQSLSIRSLVKRAEAEACARIMSTSEPWITLRRDYADSLRTLKDDSKERYLAYRDGVLAGFIILNMKGAFVGYIQTVCVAAEFRGQGIGSGLMRFAEERIFRDQVNVFLCVSSFNSEARRWYERLGYLAVGELSDYLQAGYAEILLRKTRGPIYTYKKRQKE